MPEAASLGYFLAASAALLIVPGPAVLYLVARSVEQGPRAGLISTLGISFGTLAHVAPAVLGVSAVLASSAVAFHTLKYLGAAYLICLGIQALRSPAQRPVAAQPDSPGTHQLFWQGALVNLLNPKTALFFFAFLPQFVDPARGDAGLQIGVLGCLFVGMALVSDGAYVLVAARLTSLMETSPLAMIVQRRVSGWTLIALGLATAAGGEDSMP